MVVWRCDHREDFVICASPPLLSAIEPETLTFMWTEFPRNAVHKFERVLQAFRSLVTFAKFPRKWRPHALSKCKQKQALSQTHHRACSPLAGQQVLLHY
jgi:hypothetical protein